MKPLREIDLVLGSTSRYRRELLARITNHFRLVAPDVDESPIADENPAELAARLAEFKARAVGLKFPGAVVIGSDQVADLNGRVLGKPGSPENAVEQLTASSGQTVIFHTALCVLDEERNRYAAVDTTWVRFRTLTRDEIERYIATDNPLDCAGSFKSESLGIALCESIETVDPTALVGLPMIALCRLLRQAGIDVTA